MRKNQSGFVLVETLIASVAVMGIFSLIYANYYPLIGEYEKREVYDDLDSKYVVHWARKILVEKMTNNNATTMNSCGGTCHILYGAYYKEELVEDSIVRQKETILDEIDATLGDNASYLQNYAYASNIRAIILTNYNITNFKKYIKDNNTVATVAGQDLVNSKIFNRGFREYIDYLPNYKTPSTTGASYRMIVIIDHNTSKEYDSYATIEVKV